MANTEESASQNVAFPMEEESWSEYDDSSQQPESPGTRKLKHLATTQSNIEEPEMSTRLMQRPASSGSTGLSYAAYGVAPRRDLQITKQHTAAIYDFTNGGLAAKSDIGKPPVENVLAVGANGQQRSETSSRTKCAC